MTLRIVVKACWLAVALSAVSCGGDVSQALSEPDGVDLKTSSQAANSTNKVLILGSSVSGGRHSREAQAVSITDPTTQIDVATPEQWRAMTATQFMTYRALIIGDAACQSGTAAFQAAVDTRNTWGAIVDGDVALLSTDPTTNRTQKLVENAIRFVLYSMQGRTGMYIALGCAYQDASPNTSVPLLEPFGTFKVQGVPGCAESAHMVRLRNNLLSQSIPDAMLAGNGCAARSVFTSYPERNFSFATLAMSSRGPVPGQRPYLDFLVTEGRAVSFLGSPYVLVRGAMPLAAGCGLNDHSTELEDCDLGDSLNGQPARPGQPAWDTCSFSCRLNWCGDGVVDREFGEECDDGVDNGRTQDGSGSIGRCTASCQRPRLTPPATQPPVALCQDRTVVAEYTCSESASIDHGSYDPDNDLVGCTQSPAGPFPIGRTTVTLTCTDRQNQTASCTGVVTVVDQSAPTVTLNGSERQTLECVARGTYNDPGATASDLCEGPLQATRTGSVDVGTPATYSLSYGATDASGNAATPVTRTVTVSDTRAPQLQPHPGPSALECNGTPYVDPGATALDACAGDLTRNITVSSNLDQSREGQYTVTYRVTDPSGHVSTAVRPLTVGPCGRDDEPCIDLRLGDYNLFLLEDYTGGHDVVGKVAAGGNITMTNFAVGTGLPDHNISNTLVAGGNLTLSRGAVWGHASYGGSYSSDPSVVYPRGTVTRGRPIDFAARFGELRTLSSRLASLPANGSSVRLPWGGIMLRGTSANVNVFDVNANAFNGAKLLSIDAPAGSLVVVNIRGASAHFSGFGIHFSGGIDQHGVLYNFVDATRITARGFGFWGTVLAPSAHVTFNDGSWDGGLYAKSLTGNAEGHINPLHDRDLCP
ncbi:MAG TPA: choice-of-anchor A family protein [Hyalangium sp.]|nr:choice-of-anchor A family protein [Hyalangium sp.]